MYRISIITVVKNNAQTIKDAIDSVLSQTYQNIEYIVIDGGSTDGTVEIINGYKEKIDILISEPDYGIYDAMNKGIKEASGDIIGFLNSDDMYNDEHVLNRIYEVFAKTKVDIVYGDLVYVEKSNTSKIIRYWKAGEYKKGAFKRGWHPPHPSFFVKKEIYEKYGLFDLDYRIAADYELMLRFIEKYRIKTVYIQNLLVKMRTGGESNRSVANIIKANIESYKAWKKNGLSVFPFFIIMKPLRKILQLFR